MIPKRKFWRNFWRNFCLILNCFFLLAKTFLHGIFRRFLIANFQCSDWRCFFSRKLKPICNFFNFQLECFCPVNSNLTRFPIFFRFKPDIADASRREDFITGTHQVVPKRKIFQENIHLYSLTKTHVIFVETSKPRKNYDTFHCPFWWWNLFFDAEAILLMPIGQFHDFVENFVPKFDEKRLGFIYSFGRSGSTLLGRLLDASGPKVTCFSEPEIFNLLFQMKSWNEFDEIQENRLLKNILTLMCRPFADSENSKEPHHFFIKPKFLSLPYSRKLHEIFPESKFIFIERNPLQIIHSYEKAFQNRSVSVLARLLLQHKTVWEWILRHAVGPSFLFQREECEAAWKFLKPTAYENGVRLWVNCRRMRLDAGPIPYHQVKFEALTERPFFICQQILDLFGIPEDQINSEAIENAMLNDAQADTCLSQAAIRANPTTNVDLEPVMKKRIQAYLQSQNAPNLWPDENNN